LIGAALAVPMVVRHLAALRRLQPAA